MPRRGPAVLAVDIFNILFPVKHKKKEGKIGKSHFFVTENLKRCLKYLIN